MIKNVLIYSLPFLKSFSSFIEIRAKPWMLEALSLQEHGLGGKTQCLPPLELNTTHTTFTKQLSPSPSGGCYGGLCKWTGGYNPVPIWQKSASQRGHHTKRHDWWREATGHGTAVLFLPNQIAYSASQARRRASPSVAALTVLFHAYPLKNTSLSFPDTSHLSSSKAMFLKSRLWLLGPHSHCLLWPQLGAGTQSPQGLTESVTVHNLPLSVHSSIRENGSGRTRRERLSSPFPEWVTFKS